MSTAAVSSSSIFQELQGFYQNRQTDVQQLGSALKSGDLNGAQQAYSNLAELGEDGPFANSEPFSKSSRADAFNAVGEALQAGDLARAQTAFATLTGSQSGSAASTSASKLASTTASTTTKTTAATVVSLTGTQGTASSPVAATGSTSSIYQQIQTYRQQKQADLTQLGQDLTAGNTAAAQQDFNTLTALGQSGPSANGQAFQNSSREQDFQAIGQALQAGNLAGAQTDFANLASTNGVVGIHVPPVRDPLPIFPPITPTIVAPILPIAPNTPIAQPVAVAPTAPGSGVDEIVINLGSPSSTSSASGSTTPEIVINLGQSSGSSSAAEQITINLGDAASTSTSSSIGAASTPEIVLNLGQSSGSSSVNPEEITINFGTGSGGQITIDDNQGQNGGSGQQQTISLNPQGNYELILNLLSSGQTASASSSGLSVQA
jgi:hypothetical protein